MKLVDKSSEESEIMDTKLSPRLIPARPNFSSGPCVKRPGWNVSEILSKSILGRSHRASVSKTQLKYLIDLTREILCLPNDYVVGVVPGSNTGAYEMAMWSLLGSRPVDIFAWESFGAGWAYDGLEQLKLKNCEIITAEYGKLPDLSLARVDADICFTWNGTTSGVRVPNADWISENRKGLTLCDATSAAFSQDLDWSKLDVTTFSWQKVMGGEGSHGMIVLGPRAVDQLLSFKPDRPIPKIFRLAKELELNSDIFSGGTLNTPSMFCVADAIDSLEWMKSIGGLEKLWKLTNANFTILQDWVDRTPWIENLVEDPTLRSNTSVCLRIIEPSIFSLSVELQYKFVKAFVKSLEKKKAAYDIGGHRDAPAGLRIWCGATVDPCDISKLLPWLDWGFEETKFKFFADN